jgi:hypothetical protein
MTGAQSSEVEPDQPHSMYGHEIVCSNTFRNATVIFLYTLECKTKTFECMKSVFSFRL